MQNNNFCNLTLMFSILSFLQEKAFVVDLEKRDGSLGLSVSVSSLLVIVHVQKKILLVY